MSRRGSCACRSLLRQVGTAGSCVPLVRAGGLCSFFLGVVLSLVSSRPLVLLSSSAGVGRLRKVRGASVGRPGGVLFSSGTSMSSLVGDILASGSRVAVFASNAAKRPGGMMRAVKALAHSAEVSFGCRSRV